MAFATSEWHFHKNRLYITFEVFLPMLELFIVYLASVHKHQMGCFYLYHVMYNGIIQRSSFLCFYLLVKQIHLVYNGLAISLCFPSFAFALGQ